MIYVEESEAHRNFPWYGVHEVLDARIRLAQIRLARILLALAGLAVSHELRRVKHG